MAPSNVAPLGTAKMAFIGLAADEDDDQYLLRTMMDYFGNG